MNKRPSIDIALDIRSHETVYVLCEQDSGYPRNWIVRQQGQDMPQLDYDPSGQPTSVVIVDRVDLLRRELAELLRTGPRIMAYVVGDIELEKRFRRNLRTLYPWSEVWEVHTDLGKALITTAFGRPYDREQLVDMRQATSA